MRTKLIISILIVTAVVSASAYNAADAAFSAQVGAPNMSISISDYQPAPPDVYIQNDRGRPYYMERDRRVYMEKRQHGKHYKYDKKRHEDRGRGEGHNKHDRRD